MHLHISLHLHLHWMCEHLFCWVCEPVPVRGLGWPLMTYEKLEYTHFLE